METEKWTLNELYNPAVTGINFMDRFRFETVTIPAQTYVIFSTDKQKYPVRDYLNIRRRIVSEWLPGSGYQLADAPELIMYHWWPAEGRLKKYIEIWLPVCKG